MYSIYMHKNKTNGKIYVGLTSQDVEQRWHGGNHYEHNAYFSSAIEKYGWDGFEHIVLLTGLTHDEAIQKEREYIALYHSNEHDYGYNLTPGGESYQFSDEQRKKISESVIKTKNSSQFIEKKNSIYTEEWKENVRQATLKAMNNKVVKEKMRTIYNSEEWRKNNAKTTKQQWENTDLLNKIRKANGKRVYCIELDREFYCISDIVREFNINKAVIRDCCNGKRETDNKLHYHWRFN